MLEDFTVSHISAKKNCYNETATEEKVHFQLKLSRINISLACYVAPLGFSFTFLCPNVVQPHTSTRPHTGVDSSCNDSACVW